MPDVQVSALPALRSRAIAIEDSFALKVEAEDYWPFVAANEVMSQLAGKPKVTFARGPLNSGLLLMREQFRFMGLKQVFFELPYEWVAPSHWRAEALYPKGAFQYICLEGRVARDAQGAWQCSWRFAYVPRGPAFVARSVAKQIFGGYLRAMRVTNDALKPGMRQGFEQALAVSAEDEPREKRLAQEWAKLMPDSEIPARVAHFVYGAPNAYVRKMRPFVIADHYRLSRTDLLRFCLRATRAGFLDMSWDLICPSCRGATRQAATLNEVDGEGHCESCSVSYKVDFDNHVEVTFTPPPRVRELFAESFCLASAGNTPHVVAQQNLAPGEERSLTVLLTPGEYRLRAFYAPAEVLIECREDLPAAELAFDAAEGRAAAPVQAGSRLTLRLRNGTPLWRTVKLEQLAYRDQAATARLVTSLQEFRDLFGADVLRPGVQLGVSNMILLFSDLKDSTALYENRGDAPAFSLVHDHFLIMNRIIEAHDGGVVKTIGDAVMAVFTDPAQACRAAAEILAAFDAWNKANPSDKQIVIKLGLHRGPCIALNLNDRLDYFGSTVNKAARVQGTSTGGDLVVTDALYDLRAVREVFASAQLEIAPFETELKGISGKTRLFRAVRAGAEAGVVPT